MVHYSSLLGVAVLVSYAAHISAWIPPHPNSTMKWESVHDMRRRLNLDPFKYATSKYVDAEMCRYLTEQECEESDKMMQEHIRAHKKLQTQVRQNPNLGSINVLVLMIRFSDHTDRDLISKADMDEFWQTKIPDWLDVNSQGLYSIKPTVINWVTTDNTEAYYSFGKRGTVAEAQQMAWPALNNLDNQADWDWSQFDLDGDGKIDSLVIMHSGYGAETVTTDCFGQDFNNRIWAHAFSPGRRDTWKSKDDSVRVAGYTLASVFDGDCGTVPAKIGLTAHEYMHTLGLIDLYDGVDPLAASGIGGFDIMADPYGQRGNANNPGHLSVWSKILVEWVQPKEITSSNIYTLKAAEISDEAYRITLADFGVTSEYLLIENRQPLEFDVDIWSEGLVIYHIDDAANEMKKLGYPGQPGWPQNGNHYEVAVLPKDGNYDLEKGVNSGDPGDFWVPGDRLGPGEGNTVFPNTDTYSLGYVEETGIWLEVLSQQGTDVTFQVGGLPTDESASVPATPAPTVGATVADVTGTPTQAPSKIFTTVAPSITTITPPSPIPFGQQQEVVSGPSYLSSFGSFSSRRPTPSPTQSGPTVPYLSQFGGNTPSPANPYLSNFGGSASFFNNFASVSRDGPRPFLDNFGSSAQLGPPLEGDDGKGPLIKGKVFLSADFRRYGGGTPVDSQSRSAGDPHQKTASASSSGRNTWSGGCISVLILSLALY